MCIPTRKDTNAVYHYVRFGVYQFLIFCGGCHRGLSENRVSADLTIYHSFPYKMAIGCVYYRHV